MTKPKKSKKPEKSKPEKRKIYKFIVSCALILLLVLISGLVFKELSLKENKTNTGKSIEDTSFYDANRCRCLERERLRCSEGFELDVEYRVCRNGTDITNVILACSKYE